MPAPARKPPMRPPVGRAEPAAGDPTRVTPSRAPLPTLSDTEGPDMGARYEMGPLLGAGAMGSVHQCDDRALEREVAVKMLRGPLAQLEGMRARFAREARIQGKLEHPGIVPVHDFGLDADGTPYFAMKKVRGRSLRAILNALKGGEPDERYSQRRLLGAFATVCVTVAFAHSRGVVHRDIKPSNVMLGDFGEVYLLDWGIAKEIGADPLAPDVTHRLDGVHAASGGAMTSIGQALGTVGYMAPEQVTGDVVDEKADVYALGAVLFEILTFEPLHRGPVALVMQATAHGVDGSPLHRAPGAAIPAELDQLCVRATHLDPRRRPTAREMHTVIERVLDGARHDEQSQAMSAEHVARARAEIDRAPGDAGGARERAIQELQRALALHPANVEAVALLHRLVNERPLADEISVSQKVDAFAGRAHRLVARWVAALFLPWIVSILVVLPNARDGGVLAMLLLSVVTTAGLIAWRAFNASLALSYAALGLGLLSCALMSAVVGPFVLVPAQLSIVGVIFGLTASSTGRLHIRRVAQVGAVLAFVVPLLLEVVGVLPPSFELREGGLFLLSRAINIVPTQGSVAYLVIFNLVLIIAPGVVVERVRAHEIRVERRAFKVAARMSELVPNAARAAGLSLGAEGDGADTLER